MNCSVCLSLISIALEGVEALPLLVFLYFHLTLYDYIQEL